MNEREGLSVAGIPMVLLCIVLGIVGAAFYLNADHDARAVLLGVPFHIVAAFLAKGFFQVAPNEGQVLQLFGKYAGTTREAGLRWTNPFYSRRRISLRGRNFESSKLKVNDNDGNPIEIAAIVVWQVVDTAEAVFWGDDYENFVPNQRENARRQSAQ